MRHRVDQTVTGQTGSQGTDSDVGDIVMAAIEH